MELPMIRYENASSSPLCPLWGAVFPLSTVPALFFSNHQQWWKHSSLYLILGIVQQQSSGQCNWQWLIYILFMHWQV